MSRPKYVLASLLVALPFLATPPRAGHAVAAPSFAGLFGGSGDDRVHAMAVDGSGAVFVVGTTASDGLATPGALQSSRAGGADAFVAGFAADGSTLLFLTYLGGTADDAAFAVVPDGSGGAWVVGGTESADFPVRDAMESAPLGGQDGWIARVRASGTNLALASYLGGAGDDRAAGVVVDGAGAPWVALETDSDDLPTSEGAFRAWRTGGRDAWIARLSTDARSIDAATFLGGSDADEVRALIRDAAGGVVLAGRTLSVDFPVSEPTQSSPGGAWDGFVSRIAPDLATLPFSTWIGGTGDDGVTALALGPSGLVCGGATDSADFPFWSGIGDAAVGGRDGFVVAFSQQNGLRYAAPVGGAGDDAVLGVVEAASGAVFAVGVTSSDDFPVRAAPLHVAPGADDGFLACLTPGGTALSYATYLGGSGGDGVAAVLAVSDGDALVAGWTDASDFATGTATAGAVAGGVDAVFARVPTAPLAPVALSVTAVSRQAVGLAWEDRTGGRGSFELQRRVGATPFQTVATAAPGVMTWTDTSVGPATAYAYRVRSIVEGTPSPYSAEVGVITPAIPLPAVPGAPTATPLSPRSILVAWEDRSDDETGFELFRSVDGGAFVLHRSLSAGVASVTDAVAPDRLYAYRVRSVGLVGASALSPGVSVTTEGTLAVERVSGRRTDAAKPGRDAVRLALSFAPAGDGAFPDPRIGGIEVGVGPQDRAVFVVVAPGAAEWRERRGVLTWKSPRGYPGRVTLVLDPAAGTLRVKAARLELPPCDADAVRVSLRCGDDAGSVVGPWEERKPGVITKAE